MNRRPTSLEKNVKFEQIERETSTCYMVIRFLLYVCGIVAIVGIEIFSAFSFEPSSSSTIFYPSGFLRFIDSSSSFISDWRFFAACLSKLSWMKLDDDYGEGRGRGWLWNGGLKGVVFGIGRFERELLCGLAWIFEPFSPRRGFLHAAGSISLSFASGEGTALFSGRAFKFLMIEVFWGKMLEKLNRNRFSEGILRIECLWFDSQILKF